MKSHITPASYYDDQRLAVARYIAWINTPRVADPRLIGAVLDRPSLSKAKIKQNILKGI